MTLRARTDIINSAESLAEAIELLWRKDPAFSRVFHHDTVVRVINRSNAMDWSIYRVEVERVRCLKPGLNITIGDDTRIEASLILYGQGMLGNRQWTPDRVSILVKATITKSHCNIDVTTARLLYPENNDPIVTNSATAGGASAVRGFNPPRFHTNRLMGV